MIKRAIASELILTANEFKIVCITGPRQSGKTTLAKYEFPDKPYISLEDPDIAEIAEKEGRKFLEQFTKGAILDEVHRVPSLFNYLQGIVDKKNTNNQFILTGSNHFLLNEKISQSLAGRVGYIELLPFSLGEMKKNEKPLEKWLIEGFYPLVATGKSSNERWLPNYIKTYVERDVRQIRNIENTRLFNKFLLLCAQRASQLLNMNSLAKEVGVDNKTIQAWLNVLESSYIIYFLQPYHTNLNKRVIKSPKLYFYDTGLLCSLLQINTTSALKKNNLYGKIFENFVITEIRKNRYNKEQSGNMYFFRDSTGNEVDIVIEKNEEIIPIEIKSSKKFMSDDVKGLIWFNKVFRQNGGILINTGMQEKVLENQLTVVGWDSVQNI